MLADAATVGVLFFLGFISLGVAVLSVLRSWLVENTLEFGSALGMLAAILLGTGWAVKTGSPLVMLLWIAVMLGGGLVVPTVIASADKRELHRIYESDIAKFRRAIESGINSAGAWREIGELYLRMNRYDEAIAAYKEAIRLNPQDVDKVRRRLNLALEYRAGMSHAKTVVCEECERETPTGKTCIHCGAALETNFLGWLSQADNLRDVWKPTVAIFAAAIALLTIFSALPVVLKATIILICVVTGGLLIWLAVEDTK